MSKKSNPTLIGSFVIGAVVLIVASVMLFGGAELFEPKTRVVSYFPGSVKGLRVGSNVLFRGVRVGFVEDIQLQGDADTLETQVQVIMRLFPNQFQLTRRGLVLEDREAVDLDTQDVIDAGLRAQLGVESFVTGQLLVELDFQPETVPLYRSENPPHTEVPSVPSNIQQVLEQLQQFVVKVQSTLDVEEALTDLQGILNGLDELANSTDIRESLAGLNRIINDQDTQELPSSLQAALGDARKALQDARRLVNDADAQIEPLIAKLMPAIDRLDSTLAAGEEALRNASAQIRGDTELSHELTSTLDEVQGAARSLRVLLELLERNPEAVIRGKRRQ